MCLHFHSVVFKHRGNLGYWFLSPYFVLHTSEIACKRWSFCYTLFVASGEGRRPTILGFLQQKIKNNMKKHKQKKVSFNKTGVRRMEYVQFHTETFFAI